MKYSISEILRMVSDVSNKEQKIKILKDNASTALLIVLRYAYDPNIKWLLPEGVFPYKPCGYMGMENALYSQARLMYLFVEGGNMNLTQKKREVLFVQLLESVDPEDAKVLMAIKDKKMPYKGIPKNIVVEAFPGLISGA